MPLTRTPNKKDTLARGVLAFVRGLGNNSGTRYAILGPETVQQNNVEGWQQFLVVSRRFNDRPSVPLGGQANRTPLQCPLRVKSRHWRLQSRCPLSASNDIACLVKFEKECGGLAISNTDAAD